MTKSTSPAPLLSDLVAQRHRSADPERADSIAMPGDRKALSLGAPTLEAGVFAPSTQRHSCVRLPEDLVEAARFVTFNGRPNQYISEPIRLKVGDRVRFWLVNAGPTHSCEFHVVGEQFDAIYLGAPPGTPLRGVQTWGVAAGGGMCFEVVCDVPGEFPFVNHGFGHGQKGAIGILVVEPLAA